MSSEGETLWVMGHRIRPIKTDDSYGLVEVTSPPHVPGPPPHHHDDSNEFFMIVKGTLDVMCDGRWQSLQAGSYLDLRPNTTHTFINNTEEDVVWVTGWRPKGFQQFFEDFGVPAAEPQAYERSVSDAILQSVAQKAESYHAYFAN